MVRGYHRRRIRTLNLHQDEPFHAPQAQAYCRGDWSQWDPKITTPPGLFVSPAYLRVQPHLDTMSFKQLLDINSSPKDIPTPLHTPHSPSNERLSLGSPSSAGGQDPLPD